ncbi:hypothetical protein HNY73_008735 [Argiope bruennichi]|uniref:Uncharacterized protein n=1 Tax=Argiope bruennichi TaxID=94029 RepID=A0A8T0F7E6_ARGBR|nr:hypothetical protein HNY73_008735 [Argiope bruennichi]
MHIVVFFPHFAHLLYHDGKNHFMCDVLVHVLFAVFLHKHCLISLCECLKFYRNVWLFSQSCCCNSGFHQFWILFNKCCKII